MNYLGILNHILKLLEGSIINVPPYGGRKHPDQKMIQLNTENISSISKTQIEDWKDIPGIRWLDPEKYIENIYKQVDCVVLPSYREGMPKTLLEAGSMGLPSVATNVPGCRNIIQDNVNGFLCRAKDARDLEQAMIKALNLSRNDYEKMSINARNIVKNNFDEKIVIDSALDALDSILKK